MVITTEMLKNTLEKVKKMTEATQNPGYIFINPVVVYTKKVKTTFEDLPMALVLIHKSDKKTYTIDILPKQKLKKTKEMIPQGENSYVVVGKKNLYKFFEMNRF